MCKDDSRPVRARTLSFRALLLICLAAGSAGCVDHRYDLKGDLDLTIGVGGKELAVPIGTTEKITLQKMIGSDNDQLTVMPDGSYALTWLDGMSVQVPAIAPITIQTDPFVLPAMRPNFGTLPPVGPGVPVPPASSLPAAPVVSRGDIRIDAPIPAEVKALTRVTFSDPVDATIRFEVTGAEDLIRKIRFEDMRIVFPSFITLASGGHEVVLNDEFSVASGFSFSVGIASLDFTPPLATNGSLHIDEEITLSGKIRITELGTGGDDLSRLALQPRLTIGEMRVKLVEGRVEPQIPQVSQSIELTDIPDFLRGQGTVLDVNPYINLTVGNPLGMQVDVAMSIAPVVDQQEDAAGKSDVQLRIPGATLPGLPLQSSFRIAATDAGMPVGYTFVQAANLPGLIRTIPDAVQLDVASKVASGSLQSIDLSLSDYTIRLNYELCVPLAFGPDLAIRYRDTVDNLAKDIGDFVDKVKEIKILASVDNTIPLELQAAAIAVDVQKQPLQGVEVSAPQKIAPGNGSDIPAVSAFEVVIRETRSGALARLDGLILEITANNNSSVANIPATPNQYVQLKMKLYVPGGIIMDLDDL